MKNKKVLIYYFLEFILTISIFLTLIIIILKITILNKHYFINKLESNNYYHELYLDINNDFSNYYLQSGFDESIVNNLFTEDDLKKVINNNVDNFYQGKYIKIDTSEVKNKLQDNINAYLDNKNIRLTSSDEIDLFTDEIISIYHDRIIIHNSINNFSARFHKLNNIINRLFMILLIFNFILFIIIKLVFKKIALTIPFITSGLLLILAFYLLFSRINISNIIFWNTYVSSVIKNIFMDIKIIIKNMIIGLISIQIVKLIIIYIRKSRKI